MVFNGFWHFFLHLIANIITPHVEETLMYGTLRVVSQAIMTIYLHYPLTRTHHHHHYYYLLLLLPSLPIPELIHPQRKKPS